MDKYNNTPLSRKNKHLNAYERGQIQLLKAQGLTPYAIGKYLGRVSNTIRNELKRGTVSQIKGNKTIEVYYPDTGQTVYEKNRARCGTKFKLLTCQRFIEYVEEIFNDENHSIDAICGATALHNKFKKHEIVCTKTLYNYINLGLIGISNIDLPLKVKRSNKAKRIRNHKKNLGRSISERPEHVNNRSEFGHWEIDTVIGRKTKNEPVLMTLTERKTRKEIIRKLPDRSSATMLDALKKLASDAGEIFSKAFKSITADNGSEFADLASFEQITGSAIYFAHPYTSSERGTNEHHNGLIRRFIPKGESLSNYSVDMISKVQNWCNTLPRKILNYLTPDEAFEEEVYALLYT